MKIDPHKKVRFGWNELVQIFPHLLNATPFYFFRLEAPNPI